MHDPKILLLDEPTSSMDQGTEKQVIESLEKFSLEKTMLIVTHRNPILSIVDRIFVIENGKIITDQTPDQLGIKRAAEQMSDAEFRKLAKELAGKQKSSSSVLLLVVITLILVVFVWASVTEIDNVVRGNGKTVSEAQNQYVQSSEPGVIRKRYVSEGDFVTKGQLLFDIDPVDAKTQLDQAQKRYSTLRVKSIRLKAEVDNGVPDFPQELIEAAPNAVSTELALYRARLMILKRNQQY